MPLTLRLLCAAVLACLSFTALAERLRLVTEPWAPYVTVDGQQASGLDYEMTTIVFKRLGVDVQWQFLPWKRCLLMLEQGEADGVLDILKLPERDGLLLYPNEPLSEINWVLFQANARPHPFNSLQDLTGLTIGVSPGYLYSPEFDTSTLFIREPAPTHEANFGKLARGRVDLVVTERLVGQQMIDKLKLRDDISEVPNVIARQDLYLAVRRNVGMDLLVQRFGAELKRFKQEPAYAQLVARYTAELPSAPTATQTAGGQDKTVEQQERSEM